MDESNGMNQARAEMLYPSSIVEWEMKHHIVRIERNGAMYITCTDFDAFNRQLEEEKNEQRRKALKERIARQQEAAYLAGQERMEV